MGERDTAPGRPLTGGVPRQRSRGDGSDADAEELAALRRGDESAFKALVRRLHPSMVRLATSFVPTREIGEEVAQDTWVVVLESLHRFEGRSSLRTWIFRILTNQAKTRGARERRSTPFSALAIREEAVGRAVDPAGFFDEDHRWAGHWAVPVHSWQLPDEQLLSAELGGLIHEAIDALPPAQRAVVLLRDGQSLSSREVCDVLGLSEVNQRVLLHRGRCRVRASIGEYVDRMAVGA